MIQESEYSQPTSLPFALARHLPTARGRSEPQALGIPLRCPTMVVIAGVTAWSRTPDPKIGSLYAPDRLDHRGDLPSLLADYHRFCGRSQMAQ